MESKMNKKLLIFIPTFETGGVEKNAVFFANNMLKNGYQVSVVYCRKVDNQFSKLDKGINKIKIYRLPKLVFIHDRIVDAISIFIFGYFKLKKEGKDNILIGFQSNIIGIILAKLLDIKSVVRLSNHFESIKYEKSLVRKGAEYLKKKLYKYADVVIANSNELANDYAKVFDRDVKTVYNPIDFDKLNSNVFNIPKEDIYQDKSLPIILSVGRLAKQKNFEYLINSFAVAQKQRDMNLVIVGEGEERNNLTLLIKKLKLEDKVYLIGHRDNVYDYYRNSDIFVLSSFYEGMPNALIEAIACKCLAISTNIKTGPKEILLNGDGGDLVELNNVEELSKKILENLDNKSKAIDKNLNAFNYLNRFSVEKTIESYLSIIESL